MGPSVGYFGGPCKGRRYLAIHYGVCGISYVGILFLDLVRYFAFLVPGLFGSSMVISYYWGLQQGYSAMTAGPMCAIYLCLTLRDYGILEGGGSQKDR